MSQSRGISVWGSLSRRVSVYEVSLGFCQLGSLSRGFLLRGGLCSAGSLSRGFLSGDICLGISVQGGLCPEGSLSRRVSFQGVSVWGSLSRRVCKCVNCNILVM